MVLDNQTTREHYLRFQDVDWVFTALIRPGTEILEIGSGTSQVAHNLARLGAHVTCVDTNPGTGCILMDGRALRFPDQTFGLVVMKAVLEVVGGAAAQCLLALECYRVLEPGGALLLITRCPPERLDDVLGLCRWRSVHRHVQSAHPGCLGGPGAVYIVVAVR